MISFRLDPRFWGVFSPLFLQGTIPIGRREDQEEGSGGIRREEAGGGGRREEGGRSEEEEEGGSAVIYIITQELHSNACVKLEYPSFYTNYMVMPV